MFDGFVEVLHAKTTRLSRYALPVNTARIYGCIFDTCI